MVLFITKLANIHRKDKHHRPCTIVLAVDKNRYTEVRGVVVIACNACNCMTCCISMIINVSCPTFIWNPDGLSAHIVNMKNMFAVCHDMLLTHNTTVACLCFIAPAYLAKLKATVLFLCSMVCKWNQLLSCFVVCDPHTMQEQHQSQGICSFFKT